MINVILSTYQGAILGPVARLLGYILQGLYEALSMIGIENTGICIIIFTFLVNAIMLPMQFKQQKFAKMSAIMNPELMAIQEKYKNKKDQASQQKMSMETQALYQKYGVSPASGCLPMFISFPIFLALYRVIYNIPAYVPQVYNIYKDLAETLQTAGISVESLSGKDYVKSTTYVVSQAVTNAKGDAGNINYYIDVLGQFSSKGWSVLAENYPQFTDIITSTGNKAVHINSFLGLNIADAPSLHSVSIIIPILSIITQIISVRISMAGSPQQSDPDSPTAQSVKMMNTTMPIFTGLMCLMFPIGAGIYWIAGNVFRIFQSLFINLYYKNVDMDEMIQQNLEKAKQKYEKLGMDASTLDKVAKSRTANIPAVPAKQNEKQPKKEKSISEIAGKASTKGSVKKTKGKYKEGSIAAYANLLNHDDE